MGTLGQPIYLTGPTASGKTSLGVALARLIDAEIIAMDSMTLYRGMDIGTAKPSPAERQGIAHHVLDMIEPWDAASVAQYRDWALEAIEMIQARGRRVLFVGGTPLYLKAMLRGLFDGPPADPDLRLELESEADALGNQAIHARLAVHDPATAARLPVGDRRRVIRALEVFAMTGRPLSSWQTEHAEPAADALVFAIERPREELIDRINRRVVQMIDDGFLDEVRRIRSLPQPLDRVPAQAVGYREGIDHLEGRISLAAMIETIQIRTRQFAKRQRTWFRGLEECRGWPVAEDESPEITAQRLAETIAMAN